ncbi:hypothetical protein IW262DRAFT_1469034 [Armillaria fumosa]|nr:hypothetical protein IW262DRAFT_1469034 [Armillaria fumosa]
MNDLCSAALSDQEFKGIIIQSIVPTDNWMPILLSLYQMPTSSDIISHLQTHVATLHAADKGPSQSQALTAAGAPTPAHGCRNPNCKAHNKTQHTTENCYWPGGGKEGQFPPNFSQPRCANQANLNNMANATRHFVLAACMVTVDIDQDNEGLVIEDGSTGERIYKWDGTCSFWRWDELESDNESMSNEFSIWNSTCGSDMESFTEYSEVEDERDPNMPSLTNDDDDKDEDEYDDNTDKDERPPLIDEHAAGCFTCEAEPAGSAFVTMTFEECTPAVTLTFMDSGASNYFFHNC